MRAFVAHSSSGSDAWLAGLACPSCPTTDQVRCAVLGEGFWSNVAIALAPFAVVLAVVALVHRALDGGLHD